VTCRSRVDPPGRGPALTYGIFEFGDNRMRRLLHHSVQPVCCFYFQAALWLAGLSPAFKSGNPPQNYRTEPRKQAVGQIALSRTTSACKYPLVLSGSRFSVA